MMFKEVTKKLAECITATLGIKTVVSPVLEGPLKETLATLPAIVLEGPSVENMWTEFCHSYEDDAVNEHGVMRSALKRWFVHCDLVFRLRLFFDSMARDLHYVEEATILAHTLPPIIVNGEEQMFMMDGAMRADVTPNFSNVKHFETTCRVLDVVTRAENEDVFVHECKTFGIATEKMV